MKNNYVQHNSMIRRISICGRKAVTVTLAFMVAFTMIPIVSGDAWHADAAGGCSANTGWSSWTTTAPSAGAVSESKVQYRHRTKSTTSTRTSTYTSDWTYDYRVLDSSWSWGAWSSYSTTKYTASESTTSKREVQTQTTPAQYKTQYNYSRWASNPNNTGTLGPCKGTWSGVYCQHYFEKGWSDTKLAVSSTQYSNQMGGNFNLYGNNQWFNETTRQVQTAAAVTKYRYRDGTKGYTYYWYKWSNWTDWAESEVTATSSREVEQRTLYRVKTNGAHHWDAGVVTKAPGYLSTGVRTYHCTGCGAASTAVIAKKNPAPVTPARVKIKSAKVNNKKLTLTFKKVKKNTKGYQISLKNKNTGKIKYYKVKQGKKSKLKKTIKKLKKNKVYAVRIRAYNKIGKEIIYGPWSKVKSGKVR